MTTDPQLNVALLQPQPALATVARQWARRLDLQLTDGGEGYALLLQVLPDSAAPGYRLALQATGSNAPGPVAVDFIAGRAAHRRRYGGGRGQPLARAIGLKRGAAPRVADLTAGLGRDAFVLATLGCRVDLVERVPLVAALLENGMARAAHDPEVGPTIARMHLHWSDAKQWLASTGAQQRPDVIYLDPMYPTRGKSALVKKEMQLFHGLVGADPDSPALLELAMQRAVKRVVVKRPRSATPLAGWAPGFVISSPNTRYDVYPIHG